MSNLDEPANAQSIHQGMDGGVIASFDFQGGQGFTKRERACIDLRIPESGDAELDALIEKARRQEMAAKALPECYREYMAGVRGQEHGCAEHWKAGVAIDALDTADSLISELGRAS